MALTHRLALVCALTLAAGGAGGAAGAEYDAFLKLSAQERQAHWSQATPAAKSQIAQAHATAWLTANEKRLDAAQIARLKQTIAVLTPDFYGATTPATEATARAHERQLACTIWKSDIATAFRPAGREISVTWLEDVSGWLRGCFLGT
jgi:hypothetical protein